jgi:hypothetical protein
VTPAFIVDSIRAERDRQADNIRAERHLDGATDAALGRLPEFVDEDYLAGYVGKLKELPRDGEGRIVHYSPNQHFAYGFIDGIGNHTDGESNSEF